MELARNRTYKPIEILKILKTWKKPVNLKETGEIILDKELGMNRYQRSLLQYLPGSQFSSCFLPNSLYVPLIPSTILLPVSQKKHLGSFSLSVLIPTISSVASYKKIIFSEIQTKLISLMNWQIKLHLRVSFQLLTQEVHESQYPFAMFSTHSES